MNQQRAVQPLAEGALLAALMCLLGLVSLGVPPMRVLTDFLWGIPVIVIIAKHDLRLGLMVLAVSLFLLLFAFDPITVILFSIQMSPIAICYGVLVRNKVTAGKSLVIGTLVAIVAEIIAILGFLYLAGINIFPMREEFNQMVNDTFAMLKNLGLIELYVRNGISEEMILKELSQFTELLILLIPASFVLSAIIRAFLTWLVAQRVLKRLGFSIDRLPPFSEWTLPWYWIWFMIIGLVASLAGDQYGIPPIAMVGKNIIFITSFVYMVIGLAIFTSLFKSWKLPRWLKIIIVAIAILNASGTIVLFVLIGIFDSFVIFRKLNQSEE